MCCPKALDLQLAIASSWLDRRWQGRHPGGLRATTPLSGQPEGIFRQSNFVLLCSAARRREARRFTMPATRTKTNWLRHSMAADQPAAEMPIPVEPTITAITDITSAAGRAPATCDQCSGQGKKRRRFRTTRAPHAIVTNKAPMDPEPAMKKIAKTSKSASTTTASEIASTLIEIASTFNALTANTTVFHRIGYPTAGDQESVRRRPARGALSPRRDLRRLGFQKGGCRSCCSSSRGPPAGGRGQGTLVEVNSGHRRPLDRTRLVCISGRRQYREGSLRRWNRPIWLNNK